LPFPNYIVASLILLLIFIVSIVIYFQIYKRHINKALKRNNEKRSALTPPYKITIIMSVFILLMGILISYFAGYTNAYKNYEKTLWEFKPTDVETFYAQITEIDNDSIEVEGIELNKEEFQGTLNYDFFEEQITIYQNDDVIDLPELSNGDLVSITLLTDRSGSTDIFKIELLERE